MRVDLLPTTFEGKLYRLTEESDASVTGQSTARLALNMTTSRT